MHPLALIGLCENKDNIPLASIDKMILWPLLSPFEKTSFCLLSLEFSLLCFGLTVNNSLWPVPVIRFIEERSRSTKGRGYSGYTVIRAIEGY